MVLNSLIEFLPRRGRKRTSAFYCLTSLWPAYAAVEGLSVSENGGVVGVGWGGGWLRAQHAKAMLLARCDVFLV